MKTKSINTVTLLIFAIAAFISCNKKPLSTIDNSFQIGDSIYTENNDSLFDEEDEIDRERAIYLLKLYDSHKEGDTITIDYSKIPKKKNYKVRKHEDFKQHSRYYNEYDDNFHKVKSKVSINKVTYENGVKKTNNIEIYPYAEYESDYNETNQYKRRNKSTRRNASEPTWADKDGNRYTADEIRRLRKNDPDHIYQTSGQPVYSEEEIFEKRMEEYIKDNH